ncbi:hypothetical protein AXK57_20700 [Tsukamurella pulmonis]|uniref:hypothetical protein n=1 Tax=Tsukamurella pulmonis TaxID=47312 RepID=UPI0007915F81|nr:hypothetical protein [Tsukamurella pulmonis]KXP11986.1 hypothetical protein AXK57_20700 [Tsukamurella pulmonis]
MYPMVVPVPRIHRALALIQALIAALTVVGLVIYWMTAFDSDSADSYADVGEGWGLYLLTLIAPLAVLLVAALVGLIGLAVFLARGSLVARVASCCVWAVLMLAGLVSVQLHPAFVLVLFVSLCMLLALAFADRLGGTPLPPAPGPARFVPPALPYPTGQFPAVPPHATGQFPAVAPTDEPER